MTELDERVYYECRDCCWGVSGPEGSPAVDKKMDAHESETGHHVSPYPVST